MVVTISLYLQFLIFQIQYNAHKSCLDSGVVWRAHTALYCSFHVLEASYLAQLSVHRIRQEDN